MKTEKEIKEKIAQFKRALKIPIFEVVACKEISGAIRALEWATDAGLGHGT